MKCRKLLIRKRIFAMILPITTTVESVHMKAQSSIQCCRSRPFPGSGSGKILVPDPP